MPQPQRECIVVKRRRYCPPPDWPCDIAIRRRGPYRSVKIRQRRTQPHGQKVEVQNLLAGCLDELERAAQCEVVGTLPPPEIVAHHRYWQPALLRFLLVIWPPQECRSKIQYGRSRRGVFRRKIELLDRIAVRELIYLRGTDRPCVPDDVVIAAIDERIARNR